MQPPVLMLKVLDLLLKGIDQSRVWVSIDDWFVLDVHCFASVLQSVQAFFVI